MRSCLTLLVVLGMSAPSASAYIDGGGWQVTLPEILSEFRTVTLVEVEKTNLARGAIRFKTGKPLKGVPDFKELRLQLDWGAAGPPWKELKPGSIAVHFTQASDKKAVPSSLSAGFENLIAQRACLTYLDGTWFYTTPGADGWQSGTVRRDFELVFVGPTLELAEALTSLLRGQEVTVRSRRLKNTAELQWVRYSLRAPNDKTLVRDPEAAAASGRPLPEWMAGLKDASGFARTQSALALAELGPAAAEAGPALVGILKDPDPDVRAAAVAALGAVLPDGKAAVEGLAKALTDDDWFVRFGAARALQKFGTRAAPAAAALTTALKPNDWVKDFRPVRCGAAMVALSRIDPTAKDLDAAWRMVVSTMFENERQGSFGAKAIGARLLGDCGPAVAASCPSLLKLLQDPDGDVRVASAEALLKIDAARQGAAAWPVLTAALQHGDLLVRRRAIEALGGLGPLSREILPALQPLLRDPEPEVRLAAQEAVRRMESK